MEALPWALCRQSVLWTLRGNPPLAVNAASQAWGPEHSFLDHHEYLKSAFSWRLLGPLPTSAGTPSHFHLLPQVRLRAQWVDMGVFYVARPERPPRDPPISPTTLPQKRQPPHQPATFLPSSDEVLCPEGGGQGPDQPGQEWKRASAPGPSCQEPKQGPVFLVCDWRRQSTVVRSQAWTQIPAPVSSCVAFSPLKNREDDSPFLINLS